MGGRGDGGGDQRGQQGAAKHDRHHRALDDVPGCELEEGVADRGAQRGGKRQLAEQHRRTGGHIGQHAKSHHRGQAAKGVLGVAVDVFEGIGVGVGYRHQLDHTNG